jgi:GT2 family glycosyltransferase
MPRQPGSMSSWPSPLARGAPQPETTENGCSRVHAISSPRTSPPVPLSRGEWEDTAAREVPSQQTTATADPDGIVPSTPRASLVIPTHDRAASLARTLRALAAQTVPAAEFEVLVIADGCHDGTGARCRALQAELPYRLRLLEQDNAGPAAARNRGVAEARAPLIVFVDDDVVPEPDWLAVHLAAQAQAGDEPVVLFGPLLPPRDTRLNAWGAWEERTLCVQYDGMRAGRWQPTSRQFYTGNASIARHLILEAGGFDAAYSRAEDIELGRRLKRLGCRFVYLDEARAWHYVRRSFASWARMPVAYGHATVAMGRAGEVVAVENALTEHQRRAPLIRLSVRACAGSPWRVALLTGLLRPLAVAAWAAHLSTAAYAACSVIYNLRYYAGLAEALGGAATFRRLLEIAAQPSQGGPGPGPLALAVAATLGRATPAAPERESPGRSAEVVAQG